MEKAYGACQAGLRDFHKRGTRGRVHRSGNWRLFIQLLQTNKRLGGCNYTSEQRPMKPLGATVIFSLKFHQTLAALLLTVWLFQGALEEARKNILALSLYELTQLPTRS